VRVCSRFQALWCGAKAGVLIYIGRGGRRGDWRELRHKAGPGPGPGRLAVELEACVCLKSMTGRVHRQGRQACNATERRAPEFINNKTRTRTSMLPLQYCFALHCMHAHGECSLSPKMARRGESLLGRWRVVGGVGVGGHRPRAGGG
jgi:hypothetical protein